jgi:hypothetical protein
VSRRSLPRFAISPATPASRAELDAAYFLLYGITRPDVIYILSTFQTTQQPISDGARTYTTTELILDAYDQLAASP